MSDTEMAVHLAHAPHDPAAEPGTSEFFLEVAHRIARRVAAAAPAGSRSRVRLIRYAR